MCEPINLLDLSSAEFKKFLDSFDHVFSDCDGVIWGTTSAGYSRSGDFFNLMEKFNKTVHFLSNNSLRSEESYEMKFVKVGIKNGYDRLIIPSKVIADYLKSINFNKQIFSIACNETRKLLENSGLKCKYGPDDITDDLIDCIQYVKDDEEIGAVVFDADLKINIAKLNKAIAYLKRPDVLFLVGPTEKYALLTEKTGLMCPGALVDPVAEIVKREPLVLGKPGRIYGEMAMKKARAYDPKRVLMIGDSITSDIQFGKSLGFKTLLVLTGDGKEGMNTIGIKPDYYAPSIGSIVPQLEKCTEYHR